MQRASEEIYAIQASVLRTLGSPRRLEIIHLLGDGPAEVHRIAEALEISQPTVSQHLAALRGAGLVDAVRDGREVRYELTDPGVLQACDLMRDVLFRRLGRLSSLAATFAPPRGQQRRARSERQRTLAEVQR
jgi:DNA-binding transcriptional ArsR family regulator